MSTELKTRSKAYDLTRAYTQGEIVVIISMDWTRPAITLTVSSIKSMFAEDNFSGVVEAMDLLDETVERLKLDLAQFALSKGDGMEAY